ncbi:MAG TPA: 30S ribosomal protein S17e [Candidatus Nanoarchaeia archaeon]|nr:30S ribosomal protein S17e [Candidatus Nanoarchaeia archaeon]
MGRIKTKLIKRVSFEIFEKHPDSFKADFSFNSKLMSQFAKIQSKKVRNSVAGYVTRMAKAKSRA